MDKKKGIDDLEYLAELGFKQVPKAQADIRRLRRRVRRRFWGGANALVLLVTGLVVGIGVTAALLYIEKANQHAAPARPEHFRTTQPVVADRHRLIELDTVKLVRDNFESPLKRSEPLSSPTATADAEADTLSIVMLERVSLPASPGGGIDEKQVKFIINSPVVYIYDLKVSDYRSLYFKKDRYVTLDARGLSADKSLPDAEPISRLRQEAPVYLHEELAKALAAFRRGQYDVATVKLLDVETYNRNDINCNFYLGMCFYYRKSYAKAIERFQACIGDLNNAFLQESTYYEALALLENGRKKEGIALLKRIAEDGEFYALKAQTLLDGL